MYYFKMIIKIVSNKNQKPKDESKHAYKHNI